MEGYAIADPVKWARADKSRSRFRVEIVITQTSRKLVRFRRSLRYGSCHRRSEFSTFGLLCLFFAPLKFSFCRRHDSQIEEEIQKTNMSAMVMKTGEKPAASAVVDPAEPHNSPKYYRGFVAGVFSGIAKLSGTYSHLASSTVANCNSRSPIRHHQSSITNDRQVALPRPVGLPTTNCSQGRSDGTVQRRLSTAGRMDVHGLSVGRFLATCRENADRIQDAGITQRVPPCPQ
jgi:hypothetical protein